MCDKYRALCQTHGKHLLACVTIREGQQTLELWETVPDLQVHGRKNTCIEA